MDFESQLNRRRLLQAGAGLSLAGLLAACGGDDDDGGDTAAAPDSSAAAAPESSAAAPESSAAAESRRRPSRPQAASRRLRPSPRPPRATSSRRGPRSSPPCRPTRRARSRSSTGRATRTRPAARTLLRLLGPVRATATYGKSNPLKFTFLEDDQQALAKVAAGFKTDIAHPCIAYVRNWDEAGLIQPWDTSYITGFDTIKPELYQAGVIDGEIYAIPWDWGYSSLRVPRRQGAARGGAAGTSSSTSATRAASGSSPTASRSSRSAASSTASPIRTR